MPRKPNYGQQRSEVNRAKQAKQQAKQREREEAVARRRSGRDGPMEGDVEEQVAAEAEPGKQQQQPE
jgi:hypothetical protein